MARVTTEVDVDVELDEFDDDDIVEELEKRGFCVTKEGDVGDVNGFYLPTFFDRHKLREHLLAITGMGSYVTDEGILNELSTLLK